MAAKKKRRGSRTPAFYGFGRDIVLFVGGLAGVMHETIVSTTERPTLLLLFAAMMGLPAFLRSDDVRKKMAAEDASSEESEEEA